MADALGSRCESRRRHGADVDAEADAVNKLCPMGWMHLEVATQKLLAKSIGINAVDLRVNGKSGL